MGQVTIYLDDTVLAQVKAATKQAGISQSQWIAEAVRLRIRTEWPASIVDLAGARSDFPTAEEIRDSQSSDTRRERL
jgi:hypothetical protein